MTLLAGNKRKEGERWPGPTSPNGPGGGAGYLSFLVDLGYDLTDVERYALDELHRDGTGGTEAAGAEEDAA